MIEGKKVKMLVAIQFYGDDRDVAMEVARLMADVEEKRRMDTDFCFIRRFDTEADLDTEAYVAKKFRKVYSVRSKRREKGWPDGPNGIWHELMTWCWIQVKDHAADWDVVLTTESDAVPTERGWIDRLGAEWVKAQAEGKHMTGCLVCGQENHYNGNALFDPRWMEFFPSMYGTPHKKSWDVYHAKAIMAAGRPTGAIFSDHQRNTITKDELYRERGGVVPALFHGTKDDSARKIVMEEMNI